ncbi:MAG: response regulator transcription factor [Thermodesulfobacteriota bacterium]
MSDSFSQTDEPTIPPFRETVLVTDDDSHIREVVCFALNKAGYRTVEAENGLHCMEAVNRDDPDLIILDILMPEMDGTEVCRELRRTSRVPIIFLSSKDDEIDRIIGLELGGDDYITKPFSPRELVARVKAVLRRGAATNGVEKKESTRERLHCGHLLLDTACCQVFWGGCEVVLTATEFGLLQSLMSSAGRVFSRDELMDRTYDHGTLVTDRTIDSHIRKIRAKFREAGGDPIITVRGIGYKLGPCS